MTRLDMKRPAKTSPDMTPPDMLAGIGRRRLLRGGLAVGAILAMPARGGAEQASPIPQPPEPTPAAFLARAFEMRDLAVAQGDQPYGALVVDDAGVIVGQAPSRVVVAIDPTAHAETEAIRDAARRLGRRDLSGSVLYSSSRPCPMCEAAAYWASLREMIHGADGRSAGAPGLCRG